jgi:hypothetical protein
MPLGIRRSIMKVLSQVPDAPPPHAKLWRIKRLLGLGLEHPGTEYLDTLCFMQENQKPMLYSGFMNQHATGPSAPDYLQAILQRTKTFPGIDQYLATDKGLPSYPGIALESVNNSSVTIELSPIIHLPQQPYGIGISSSGAGITLRWLPVVRFSDLADFSASSAPSVDELSSYRVFRATTPILATWTEMTVLSTATWSWTDAGGGTQYYYMVRAENSSGLSARSVIRTMSTKSVYLVATDDQSYYEVPVGAAGPFEGTPGNADSAYVVTVTSHPQDLGTLNGRVVKSLDFKAYLGGRLLEPTFAITDQGILHMHYEATSSSVVASGFGLGGSFIFCHDITSICNSSNANLNTNRTSNSPNKNTKNPILTGNENDPAACQANGSSPSQEKNNACFSLMPIVRAISNKSTGNMSDQITGKNHFVISRMLVLKNAAAIIVAAQKLP